MTFWIMGYAANFFCFLFCLSRLGDQIRQYNEEWKLRYGKSYPPYRNYKTPWDIVLWLLFASLIPYLGIITALSIHATFLEYPWRGFSYDHEQRKEMK